MKPNPSREKSVVQNFGEAKKFAMHCFEEARGSHDWSHTERVYNLSMHIGKVEKADLEVLKVASLLHDVGRSFQDASKGEICHAEKGGEIAQSLLENYPFSDEQKTNVIHCIQTHRYRGRHKPKTLEAKVLYDSDKLDAIGAIGIGRAFLFAGEVGATLHNPAANHDETKPYTREDTAYREFRVKLSKIKDHMLTSEGRRMAEARHGFMEEFFERLNQEYKGII